ncbi:MAG TPA: universal stress protein, partial [Mycobacterium sp.]|nr:universal stress protein [Mycobacterium sp.]
MTVVVGYRAGEVGLSGLHLAVRAARTLGTSLTVATIVPKPWLIPSLARVDAEYKEWADHLAADSAKEAADLLHSLADGVEVTYIHRAHRSVSAGLIEVVEEVGGEV